ncbi:MAG: bestrophin family protein [Xenococcaceae cyanobacterium]
MSERIKNSDRDKRYRWFKVVFKWRGSVIPVIFPRVLFCGIFGFLISLLHYFNFAVALPILSSVVPSIVLGLLLVFRTNTAYERYWEGRKLWGTLVNNIRNLSRTIWITIAEEEAKDRQDKIKALRLLVAFAITTKLHLRSQSANSELISFIPKPWLEKLQTSSNRPLEISFWIGDYLQKQHDRDRVNSYQLSNMFKLLDSMVDSFGGCERILKTPIPLAYSIHLKQLLLIYCLTLPFQVVKDLEWWTAPIVGIIGFTVFGIEAIGIEIENPFGCDPNDLPLDNICKTIQTNIEELITLAPCVRHWDNKV